MEDDPDELYPAGPPRNLARAGLVSPRTHRTSGERAPIRALNTFPRASEREYRSAEWDIMPTSNANEFAMARRLRDPTPQYLEPGDEVTITHRGGQIFTLRVEEAYSSEPSRRTFLVRGDLIPRKE